MKIYNCTSMTNETGHWVLREDWERVIEQSDALAAECGRMRSALENWKYVWEETQCEQDDGQSAYDATLAALSQSAPRVQGEEKDGN